MKTFKLHLIRHGITAGNLQGLYIGSGTDIPLCDEGRAQLADLSISKFPITQDLFIESVLVFPKVPAPAVRVGIRPWKAPKISPPGTRP